MLPKVAIVGRPNVGKSSLLNLLAGRRLAIVDATAGVTRDRLGTVIDLPAAGEGREQIELIDTGGYGIDERDAFAVQVENQIALALAEAQLVLLVIDAQAGLVPADQQIGRLLHGRNALPVVVVANKVDSETHVPDGQEAAALGFGEPVCVSATSGFNKRGLFEAIRNHLDFEALATATDYPVPHSDARLAMVGKRNAGKSTLVNALARQQRMIVSEIEGTTRDAVDVRFEINGRIFTAIDTAGVRKRKSIKSDVDFYSLHRALRSIRRANVVLLLIDSTVPLSTVDRQLANEILKHHRPCVVVVNKWDLVEQSHTQESFADYLDHTLMGLKFAPIAFISAARAEGLRDLVAMAMNLHAQASHRVATAELNRVIEKIVRKQSPPAKQGKRLKIYYATQLATCPPTIGLFVNNPQLLDPTYQRYLINRFRDMLPFSEVPIKLLIRARHRLPAEERRAKSD